MEQHLGKERLHYPIEFHFFFKTISGTICYPVFTSSLQNICGGSNGTMPLKINSPVHVRRCFWIAGIFLEKIKKKSFSLFSRKKNAHFLFFVVRFLPSCDKPGDKPKKQNGTISLPLSLLRVGKKTLHLPRPDLFYPVPVPRPSIRLLTIPQVMAHFVNLRKRIVPHHCCTSA